MGIDYAIDVEPRQTFDVEVTDAEIEAHYRANVPTGDPPLAAIRDHVVRAIAMERVVGEGDPIESLERRFADMFGRDRFWWDASLEAIAVAHGVTPLGAFQRDYDGDPVDDGDPEAAVRIVERREQLLARGPARVRWCDAADGLRTIRALRAEIDARRPELRDHLECLALVEAILVLAERDRRRWRLLVLG